MGRFINPFSDFGFKRLFGQEISKDLLIVFLNDLLVGERIITDLTFLDKEQLAELREDRVAIYDIYCTTDTGEKIIVEMQNRYQPNFKDRALFYLSRAVVSQAQKGNDWRYDLKAVYGVFFMNFSLEKGLKFRTDIIMIDRDTKELFTDKFREIFISLPQFTKEEEECKTDFERWIYVLKNMPMLDRMPFEARNAVFKRLGELAEVGALSKEDMEKYQTSLDVHRDNMCVLEQAKLEGLNEGEKKGEKKGIIQTAKNLKNMGLPIESIVKATGLSEQEIEFL